MQGKSLGFKCVSVVAEKIHQKSFLYLKWFIIKGALCVQNTHFGKWALKLDKSIYSKQLRSVIKFVGMWYFCYVYFFSWLNVKYKIVMPVFQAI